MPFRTTKTVKTAKTVMKATPLKIDPLSDILKKSRVFKSIQGICVCELSGTSVLDIQSRYGYRYALSPDVSHVSQGIALYPPIFRMPKRGGCGLGGCVSPHQTLSIF